MLLCASHDNGYSLGNSGHGGASLSDTTPSSTYLCSISNSNNFILRRRYITTKARVFKKGFNFVMNMKKTVMVLGTVAWHKNATTLTKLRRPRSGQHFDGKPVNST